MARHVVVIGAGISGLAAAYYLRRAGVRTTVLDKASTLGGHLRVSDVAGLPVDEGAESLLNRRPEAVELAREVGLSADLVYPISGGAGIWTRGEVRSLPKGTVMGVPGDPSRLANVLTADELVRIEADRTLPGMPLTHDVAVGRFVAERMGHAVTDRLVEPLLAGVYAGRADELSLDATVPALAQAVRSEGSLLEAVQAVQRAGAGTNAAAELGTPAGVPTVATARSSTPVFVGIRGGVGRLADATAKSSGAEIRLRTTARGLARSPQGWQVESGPAPRPELLEADAVVIAVPAAPAARLLADAAPIAAAELGQIEQASVGIVTLALPLAAFPHGIPASSGFLVPPIEGRTIKAVTLSSVKWPWLGELADGLVVLRASVGRNREVSPLQRTDEELVATVLADLNDAIGLSGAPVDTRVTRWGGALPQYTVGHVERIARIDADVRPVPGLAVCGAAYDGVGVAACVARARKTADTVLAELGAMPPSRV